MLPLFHEILMQNFSVLAPAHEMDVYGVRTWPNLTCANNFGVRYLNGQIFSWNIAWPLIIWPTHLFLRDRATRKLNCERFRRLDIESCRFWQLDVDDAIGSYHQLRSLLISCLDAYVPWIAFGPESSTTRFRPRAPWKHSIISILVTLTKPNSRHATQRNKTRC